MLLKTKLGNRTLKHSKPLLVTTQEAYSHPAPGKAWLKKIKELLEYDPATGLFTWKVTRKGGHAYKGCVAGGKTVHGYISIGVAGLCVQAQYLAWFFSYGKWAKFKLDHKNRIRSDNRKINIRPATFSQNMHNSKDRVRKRPVSRGVKVIFKRNKTYYYATICVNRKIINLGGFSSDKEAAAAYKAGSVKYFGEYSPYWRGASSCS